MRSSGALIHHDWILPKRHGDRQVWREDTQGRWQGCCHEPRNAQKLGDGPGTDPCATGRPQCLCTQEGASAGPMTAVSTWTLPLWGWGASHASHDWIHPEDSHLSESQSFRERPDLPAVGEKAGMQVPGGPSRLCSPSHRAHRSCRDMHEASLVPEKLRWASVLRRQRRGRWAGRPVAG